jgi:Carboxypeptidase regulatory-like domain/TonB dependent receptor/TonB-dependent Receptor Plug Domain
MRFLFRIASACLLALSLRAYATVFATVHGVVHDPQHRPVAGAHVLLKAINSQFALHTETDTTGDFNLPEAPLGVYHLEVASTGFATFSETITVASGTNPVLHIALDVAGANQTIMVNGAQGLEVLTDTATPTTIITQSEINETPGASRTLGMQMITDYVPGAYMTHDMLHIDGGHQTSWLLDGVAIPNMKIGSNVGPQIDPKDIDSLEIQRGSYSADEGDRTYGVFNVVPRNGFERSRQAELRVSAGNLYTGETQFSLGDHTTSTAWYASLTGSRSNYGLATPVTGIYHDATNSGSGFLSLIRNQGPKDQLRITGQYRRDYFQVPYDPNPDDWQQASQYYQSFGLRDGQSERDAFLITNWVHTFTPKAMLSVAPFYHYNQANYDSRPDDEPVATTWHQSSHYAGAQADARAEMKHNDFSAGLYSFYSGENDIFGMRINDGSAPSVPNAAANASAGLVEFYLADHLRLGRYVTLIGGERFSVVRGDLNESAIYPRIGATVQIPRLRWVLRGFYGHFLQPAPLETVSSSVLNYASGLPDGQNTFTPVPSERDEEHQFGIQIPFKGWLIDVANEKNRVRNFLDHANLGESNLFFPIAVDGALVRSWQLTLRSPQIARRGQFHLAYSNQIAEQRGAIIGGFTCGLPGDEACSPEDFAYEPVDHDQRHTLNTGFSAVLPLRTWFASNVYYGSGFVNGLAGSGVGPYQGDYLPAHTTFDVSAGRSFGENLKVSVSAINVTNHRVLLDNSVTIGGFHYNDPRMLSGEVRYRFKF